MMIISLNTWTTIVCVWNVCDSIPNLQIGEPLGKCIKRLHFMAISITLHSRPNLTIHGLQNRLLWEWSNIDLSLYFQ